MHGQEHAERRAGQQPAAEPAGAAQPASRGAAAEPAVEMSPGEYIVKVDRATGEPLSDPIDPAELLVHAHRDRHPVEIAAQFLASRLIHLTGNESLVKQGLKGIERAGRARRAARSRA